MIDQSKISEFIAAALQEDVGPGDHTSNACIDPRSRSQAVLLVKDTGVIAGVDLAKAIFSHVDPTAQVDIMITDGSDIAFGNEAFRVSCNTLALLQAERIVLNTMQRMSAIATLSSRFAVEVEGLDVTILDTRKTTPLIRFLEKWAVEIGGCTNYRNGLYDWIMIKDNHIDASGGITASIQNVNRYLAQNNLDLGITIEVRNLVELHEVLESGGITRIMLDNFEIPLLREAVHTVAGRFQTEASGGIKLQNVRAYAETGINYISVGALTHSSGSLDLSLKILK
ncbi:MAG: carboxylating nicotinate-nucleotide diphosphorylase [Saprospiraceae bacterium]|nr:carboxylating nicotinate-nucleotide diphosphorylase [Saprospiraceae bacterium]